MARDCYHRFKSCSTCKKKGHLAATCQWNKQQGNLQHLEEEADGGKGKGETYDFFTLEADSDARTTRAGIVNMNCNIEAKPIAMNVKVNGIKVNMEVDTGTYMSVISRETKDRLFPAIKINEISKKLNAYGKIPLEQDGFLDNLQVEFKGIKVMLSITVMTRSGPTLIGRQ